MIASLPNLIESNCKCARTLDVKKDDKTITLNESCVMFGKWTTSSSKAVISEPNTGKWVNWNYFISADYWVIDVD